MTVLGEMLATEFSRKHERSGKPLARFLEMARATCLHMSEVTATLPATDYDPGGQTYIFDIGGNKYRLLANIDFEEQIFNIRAVLTHEQYHRK
jgi:mRNA interferase HigB